MTQAVGVTDGTRTYRILKLDKLGDRMYVVRHNPAPLDLAVEFWTGVSGAEKCGYKPVMLEIA
jgi:hypothetical protein